MRKRIKELASRGYADPSTTPGYVLLFIPNESVYAFIHEHDRDLVRRRARQRVVLCSPFTLFAVLGGGPPGRRQLPARAGIRRDPRRARGLPQQWQRFSEHVDKLGKQLGTVQGTYDELARTRRRQLERRLDEIEAIRTRQDCQASTAPRTGRRAAKPRCCGRCALCSLDARDRARRPTLAAFMRMPFGGRG